MPKVAANLTMLFTEVPFLDRFEAASRAGFKYVEFLFPYDFPQAEILERLHRFGLEPVLINLPAGNWAAGERGLGANPLRQDEFRAGVQQAVSWAKALGVPRMNCLAGKAVPGVAPEAHRRALTENVRHAGEVLGEAGLSLTVEPINHFDMPGFVLNTTRQALEVLAEVNLPNVYVQYDVYHAQREEGNLVPTLREFIGKIGHIQVADNPGRHQPGTGEINYPYVFAEIDRLGYKGFVSLEYIPSPNTAESLGWIREMGCDLA